jgi:hypothetical protein
VVPDEGLVIETVGAVVSEDPIFTVRFTAEETFTLPAAS